MELNYVLKKYQKTLINNFIIHTSQKFKNKWSSYNIDHLDNFIAKRFLLNLVEEIKIINKNLLKSLFIFSKKKNILYLSNLIYQFDNENFDDPIKEDLSPTSKSNPIMIKNNNRHKEQFDVSSCFTPPDFFYNHNYWSKKPIYDLEDVISCSY